MREILFRGKRKDNGEWVNGFYTLYANNCGVHPCILTGTEQGCVIPQFVVLETVGQYTGLTDKNGKKIFEGDILRKGTRMGYMLFEKGCFRFRWKNFDKYRPDFFKTCIITEYGSFRELEVIGNIHDNPDLLSGE